MAEDAGYRFVMSFVASSDRFRSQFTEKWQEVVSNFILDGATTDGRGGEITPFSKSRIYRTARNRIFLRDPETHKLVMAYAAKLVRSILGDKQGEFVQAQPVGFEDAAKAQVATRLLRYDFNLPGHFRTLVEAVIDMLLFGTSVVECYWRYEEREILVRNIESDGITEVASTMRGTFPVYDDVCLRNVDVLDFYPDPARYRLEEMSGCAKKFKMNGFEAQRMADSGYYRKAAVQAAMTPGGDREAPAQMPNFREGLDQPANRDPVPDFKDMTGYEYWGDVPKECAVKDDDTGELITRGVITVLEGQVVRAKSWPLTDHRLPFFSFVINPVQGRFYGISPAEVIRYDQSFADALKMLLAQAVIRMVHPPIAFDVDSELDVAQLREWKADLPIAVRGGPNSIGTLRYDADLAGGWGMLTGLKSDIQSGSGALGGIQGEEGPDREAATVGAQRIQMALDRPELAGMILESECLPQLAKSMLKRNQQFIDDTADLARRVGELPAPFWIGDLLADYDVRFVGSRNAMSRQEKLQAFDRLVAYSQAVPAFQLMLPNVEIAQMMVGDLLGLPEAAAMIGDPKLMMMNMMMSQVMGMQQGGAGQNGVPQSSEPAGMLPAQAGGAPVQ